MRHSPLGGALVSLLLLTLACPDEEHGAHEGEHGEAEQGGHDEHHADAEDSVRVEHGMLRDLRVTTQAAESRPAGDSVTVLGELQVNEDAYAEIGVSAPARVSKVLASPGDAVTAGQALVELESPEVGKARVQLRSAAARVELARQTLERRRGLARDKIVSEREMQATQAELTQAELELRAAQDMLETFGARQGQGSRFLLRTPIAGTVIERSALLGRRVDAERPLFVVGDLRRLWLVVHAFERDALRIRTSTTAIVSFPALPGQPAKGTVTRIGSRVDPTSRTVDVRVELDNPTGVLRPGMSATALVPLGNSTETVVAVPVEALQRSPEGWCVFLPKEEAGVFEIRPVARGRDLGAEVEVLSGLRAGERVVKDGAFLLKAEADKARGGGDGEHHH